MHQTRLLLAVAGFCISGCNRHPSPLQRFIDADRMFCIAYTNEDPVVSEQAIIKHREFLQQEMGLYGITNYVLQYAFTLERLARAHEKRSATNEARGLRGELRQWMHNMKETNLSLWTVDDVAKAVTRIDSNICSALALPPILTNTTNHATPPP